MAEDVKYRKIFEQLRKEIREGCYRYGEPLPSEEALVRKYKVSRITAVRAMDELVRWASCTASAARALSPRRRRASSRGAWG